MIKCIFLAVKNNYHKIMQHDCFRPNYEWQGVDKLLVDDMVPRNGNSIVVIQSPNYIDKCYDLTR